MRRLTVCAVVALGWVGRPASALALFPDGARERTPVVWEDPPCMTVVDRQVDPVVHFDYTAPYEDPPAGQMVSPDEVPDGRRYQFFGFCRDFAPQDVLPAWITQTDVDAAAAIGLVGQPPDSAILERSAWVGCFERITADDGRLPITFAQAAQGVDWDTTAVPEGTYVVLGYTWDPPRNRWSPRPGAVKIADDPATAGPAAALLGASLVVEAGMTVGLDGCVDALDGSQGTVFWSVVGSGQWVALEPAASVSAGPFAMSFVPPASAYGQQLVLRLDVTDPAGRTYSAFRDGLVTVLDEELGCATGSECGTGSTTGAAATSGSGGTEDSSGPGQTGNSAGSPDSDGCSCRHQGVGGWLGLACLLVVSTRRRR